MAQHKALGPNLASERMEKPFTAWDIISPHLDAAGGPWTWTHYGIYLPRLPAPWRYLNVLVMFGDVDLSVFKHDEYLAGGRHAIVPAGEAARLTTVMSSTAAADQVFSRGYDSAASCRVSPSSMAWAGDFAMELDLPRTVRVQADFDDAPWGFALELELQRDTTAVWFISAPYYDHLALPVRGALTIGGETVDVSGSLEFARCKPPPVPAGVHAAVAASTNYFVYHVVEVDEGDVQVLWGEVRNGFAPPRKFAYVRRVPDGRVLEAFTTELDVSVVRDELVTDSLGRVTRLPREFRAVVVRERETVLVVVGTAVTSPREGAGGGYVAGYEASVEYRGRRRRASGMFEWVDLALHGHGADGARARL